MSDRSSSQEELGLRSTHRDPEELRVRLEAWLATKSPGAVIGSLMLPEHTGISSVSALVEATVDGRPRSLVARLAPESDSIPVFPSYDLAKQFTVMNLVSPYAPLPTPLWHEADRAHLGSEFIVMERVEGRIPPDVLPYTFGSWLKDAAPEDQRHLQDESVRMLAAVHATPMTPEVGALLRPPPSASDPTTDLEAHLAETRRYYEWCAADGVRAPVLDDSFAWLGDNRPAGDTESVLSWGDSRIGNIIFRGFDPVALLDWEMAAVGPRELDVAWMIYLHRWFDDITEGAGMDPMRHFMRPEDVVARYEEASGVAVSADLRWYLFYAALRHGVIMFRVARRPILFGDAVMPADPDHLVMHHATLRRMLEGSYWEEFGV